MSNAHDYYKPGSDHHPDMRNKGEGDFYIEPDWFANHHDGALPTVSTIGRGPKGYSVGVEADDAGNVTITSDDPMTDPITFHLGNWEIWITQEDGEIEEGTNTKFTIHIKDGDNVTTKDIIVPCGAKGPTLFYAEGLYEKNDSDIYVVENIMMPQDGYMLIDNWPYGAYTPRVGDSIMIAISVDGEMEPGYGTIMAIQEDGYFVVYAPTLLRLVEVYETVEVPGDFEMLSNIPSINGITLGGNQTSEELDISPYIYSRTVPFTIGQQNQMLPGSGGSGSAYWRIMGTPFYTPINLGDNLWAIPITKLAYQAYQGTARDIPYIQNNAINNPFLFITAATGYTISLAGIALNAIYAEESDTIDQFLYRIEGIHPSMVSCLQKIRNQSTNNVSQLSFGLEHCGKNDTNANGVYFEVSGYILIYAEEV